LADGLTFLALALSAVTLILLVFVVVNIRRKPATDASDPTSIAATMDGVRSSVTNLQNATNQLLTTVGKIEQTTSTSSTGITDIKKVTDLLVASSQTRGKAGEMVIRQYLEKLPRELWEEQFYIPGSEDRVDYVLRIYNDGVEVFLPIDSKFSLPDEADDFDKEANRLASKRADEVVKYIVPGKTTDFVVMVLPNRVYYSLTSDTVGELERSRIIPCPPEGVMILCNLAVRAHQAVILTQSAERLRKYVLTVDQNLGLIKDAVAKWGKNLRNASKSAGLILKSVNDMHDALGEITSSLDGGSLKPSPLDEVEVSPLPQGTEMPHPMDQKSP
jgi:DNA anti-recombination protein RmuC